MFAVVQFGNQQYRVAPGVKLKVDKLDVEAGKTHSTDKVLLVNDKDLLLGTPYVEGAVCEIKVLEHGKLDKVLVFKKKPKKRYERTQGHRQACTEIEILKIEVGAKKAAAKAEAKVEAKVEAAPAEKKAVKAPAKKPATKAAKASE